MRCSIPMDTPMGSYRISVGRRSTANPYNLFIAAAQLDLNLARSWMIGDRESDVALPHGSPA
jgi:hypothetical protein